MVEILSPARDLASLSAAISNGADAVYLGLEGHQMRAQNCGFSLEQVKKAIKLSHEHDVKLYLCTNTIMNDKDIDVLRLILPKVSSMGVDAIIASDLGVLKVANEEDIDVHFSVQANISNSESLNLLNQLGVSRVILSRELNLDEIRRITKLSPVEIEVFVHGAMCLAVSGRCFLSSYLYQKSANCGDCLQPCRKPWKLISEEEELFVEAGQQSHILSPRDLCMVEYIPELVAAGISAFKIEGRARPADYVATVTRVYRDALDSYMGGHWQFKTQWLEDLASVFNRGFDTGFFFKKPYLTSSENRATHKKKDIGQVINYYSNVKAAEIRLWDDIKVGDSIIIQGPTTGSITMSVESMQIENQQIIKAHKGQNIGLKVSEKVRPNDLIYRLIPK